MASELDLMTIVKRKLSARNIPADLISKLSGVSSGHLSKWLNDRVRLDNPTSQRVYDEVLKLERLIQLVEPLPVDFRESALIKEVLDMLDGGDLKIVFERNDFARCRTILLAIIQSERNRPSRDEGEAFTISFNKDGVLGVAPPKTDDPEALATNFTLLKALGESIQNLDTKLQEFRERSLAAQ